MSLKISFKFFLFFSFSLLFSCHQNLDQQYYSPKIEKNSLEDKSKIDSLSQNHDLIDLSQTTLEQQRIDKKEAAEKLQKARKERIEIEINNIIDYSNEINVAEFARKTYHKRGEKIFFRIGFSIYDNWNECSKFKTRDEAQRKFLSNGGPNNDKFNLDPDGDGFACEWDPKVYRELNIPTD